MLSGANQWQVHGSVEELTRQAGCLLDSMRKQSRPLYLKLIGSSSDLFSLIEVFL